MQLLKSNRQILVLYSSTILGVLVGILISILNTRYLNPAAYGDVRYVNNLIQFFSGILLFGYFISGCRLLALAETPVKARQIKGILVTILGVTVLILMLIMLICGLIHKDLLHKSFYYLFYCVIPFCGSALLLNYINTSSQGDNSISMIAMARLLPQLCYLFVAFILYRQYGATSERMLLLQNGVYFIVLLILIYRNHPSFVNLKDSFIELHAENKKYGLQVYYGSLMNVSVQYIAGITLGLFGMDNTDVGFYTLALTVTMPLATLPNVIGTTYFRDFAHQPNIKQRILYGTFLMSLVSIIGFVIFIYPLVDILYDHSYSRVATYACFLALGSTLQGLGDVFNRFLGAHGQGRFIRNAAWYSGAVAICGYIFAVYWWGINGAIITRIISSTIYFMSMIFYYKREITVLK